MANKEALDNLFPQDVRNAIANYVKQVVMCMYPPTRLVWRILSDAHQNHQMSSVKIMVLALETTNGTYV